MEDSVPRFVPNLRQSSEHCLTFRQRRARSYGKKVAVVEQGRLGGTCVNVGQWQSRAGLENAHVIIYRCVKGKHMISRRKHTAAVCFGDLLLPFPIAGESRGFLDG